MTRGGIATAGLIAFIAACGSGARWESDEFAGSGGTVSSGGRAGGGPSTGGRSAGGAASSGGSSPGTGGAVPSGGAGGTPNSGGASAGGAGGTPSGGASAGGVSSGGGGAGGSPLAPHPGVMVSYPSQTPYQRGEQRIRVLLPTAYDASRKYRVLYVLPVESGNPLLFGDGIAVLQSMKAHDTYNLILVEPSFAVEPWYGDHASDSAIRQAAYLVEQVVPFIERSYAVVPERGSRLLLGFSKSGWGAFSLILKHPDFFGYAAAWDSPMMFDAFHYGMKSVFGTQEQLDAFRPDLLAARNAAAFAGAPRLVLTGENLWGGAIPPPAGTSHTVECHRMLEALGIAHLYDGGVPAFHNWNSVWVERTLSKLMEIAK